MGRISGGLVGLVWACGIFVLAVQGLEDTAPLHCDNSLSCLNLELYRNVSRMADEDVYRLSDRLFLERFDGNVSTGVEERDWLREKNAVSTGMLIRKVASLLRTHALKYRLIEGLDVAVFRDEVDGKPKLTIGLTTEEPRRGGRTFGVAIFRKRMMYILLAMTFKMGIMTTLLITILVLVLKGLNIGVLLLVLSFGSALAKWKLHGHHAPSHWKKEDDAKNIHIHVHGGDKEEAHKQAYSAWAPQEVVYPHHPPHPVYHRRQEVPVYPEAVTKAPVYNYRWPAQYYQTRSDQVEDVAGYNRRSGVEDAAGYTRRSGVAEDPMSVYKEYAVMDEYPVQYGRREGSVYYPGGYQGKGYQIEEVDQM